MEKLRNIIKQQKKKNLVLLVLSIVLIVFTFSNFFNGKDSEAMETVINSSGGREDYSVITAVPEVTFEMNKELTDYATAVVEISSDIVFDTTSSYSYKNGTDTYMAFCMENYVVIAHKGTKFNFAEESVKESFSKHSLEGIWFTERGENSLKNEGNKYVVDVTGQVVITNLIYNDFYGKLTTITENGEEWSLFVGITDLNNEQMTDFVTYIISTFKYDPSNEGEDLTVYEVSIEETPELKAVAVSNSRIGTLAHSEDSINLDDSIEDFPNETIEINSDMETEGVVTDLVEPIVSVTENAESNDIENSELKNELESIVVEETAETLDFNETSEEYVIESETEVESGENEIEIEDSSEDEEDVEIQETEMTVNDESEQMISESKIFRNPVTIPNNQTNVQYEEDKAYTSTIYSMLKVSQIGYMSIINQESVESEQGFIKVVSVNGKEDTEKLIKEYISSGDAYYSTMECPTGCHWESITYDVKYPDPTGLYYTNIEFVGLDGELLKYKGVQYSKRTYDILNRAKENNGWNEGFIAFYAVPNGCTQYAIACGDPAGDGYQAYYKITGERKK